MSAHAGPPLPSQQAVRFFGLMLLVLAALVLGSAMLGCNRATAARSIADFNRAQILASQFEEEWDARAERSLVDKMKAEGRPLPEIRAAVAAHRQDADRLDAGLLDLARASREAARAVREGRTFAQVLPRVAAAAAHLVALFARFGVPVPPELAGLAQQIGGSP